MANYRLSKKADREIEDIYRYSFQKFGEKQADRYLKNLHDTFAMLAEIPTSGRRCDHIKQGYRRHEHSRHIIFYKITDDSIFITRILGTNQKPQKQIHN